MSGSQGREIRPDEFLRCVGHVQSRADKLHVSLARRVLTIDDPSGDVAWLLGQFSGFASVEACIIQGVHRGMERGTAYAMVQELCTHGVLVPTEHLCVDAHALGCLPMPFHGPASVSEIMALSRVRREAGMSSNRSNADEDPLTQLALRRSSCRAFEPHATPVDEVVEVLSTALASDVRAAPSAGGLYATKCVVLSRESDDRFRARRWSAKRRELIALPIPLIRPSILRYVFDSEDLLHGADHILVLTADITISAVKYSNRGYRFSLLEAGHVAQMVLLAATQRSLGSLEWGDYLDGDLQDSLRLSPREWPLTVIGVGKPGHERVGPTLQSTHERLHLFVDQQAGMSWVARRHPLLTTGEAARIVIAQLEYRSDDESALMTAGGVARSAKLAEVRAMAEGIERFASLEPRRKDLNARPTDGRLYLPSNLLRRADEADEGREAVMRDQPLARALDTRGETWVVPAQAVFYARNFRDRIAGLENANSGGVAAAASEQDARERAVLELIERDAIARAWVAPEPPLRWSDEDWPEWFQYEIDRLKGASPVEIRVMVVRGLLPTIMVWIVSPTWPALSMGAAAQFDPAQGLEKAWLEAYAFFLAESHSKERAVPEVTDVLKPKDHGKFYSSPENLRSIERFAMGMLGPPPTGTTATMRDIIRALDPVFVDLTPPDSPVQVVRALTPNLRLLHFGWHPQGSVTGPPTPDWRATVPHPFP